QFWDEVRKLAGESLPPAKLIRFGASKVDASRFAKAFLKFLKTPRGRKRLEKRWGLGFRGPHPSLANHLGSRMALVALGIAKNPGQTGKFPDLKQAFEQEDESIGLDLGRFQTWLAETSPPPGALRELALLGCGFALLFPNAGRDLFQKLSEGQGELRSLLG